MNKILKCFTLIFIFNSCCPGAYGFTWPWPSIKNWFKPLGKRRPEDNIKALQKKQINNPKDPIINYNLGVAQYKAKKYADAKANFGRAALHSTDELFKERAYFNQGNSGYHNTLSMLPKNWEKPDVKVDNKILDKALIEVSESIENFDTVLELNEENKRAETNKKQAEELRRKLLEKKQQQQDKQDQKDDEQDKDQNKDKDQKDPQDKQNQQNQNDSQNQKDSSKDQEEGGSKDDKQDQQDGSGDQKPKDRDDQADDKSDQQDGGHDDKSEDKQPQEQKDQDSDHGKGPGKEEQDGQEEKQQPTPSQGTQGDEETQGQASQAAGAQEAADEEESSEKKAYRAILDNLDSDESSKQKQMIYQKTKGARPPQESGKKPW